MRVSEIQQLELHFSSEEKVQMLVNFNRHLELENESLREENDMLRRMLFGKKSEKIVCEKIGIEEQPPISTAPSPSTTEQAEQKQSKKRSVT